MNFIILIFKFIVLFLSLSLIKPVTNYLNQSYCKCRTGTIKGRIYGGAKARADELNFVAILFSKTLDDYSRDSYSYENFCTAVLINPLWLITAGQCLKRFRSHELLVNQAALGLDHDLNKIIFNKRHFRDVIQLIPHPEFKESSSMYDFALVKVASAFELGKSTNIFAACLDMKGRANLDVELLTAGYGRVYYLEVRKKRSEPVVTKEPFTHFHTNDLKKMTLKKFFGKYTVKSTKETYTCFEDAILCAKNEESSVCVADSGGPLMAINTYTHTQHLIGIVSVGPSPSEYDPTVDCGPTRHMYFPEIKSVIKWIKNYTEICGDQPTEC